MNEMNDGFVPEIVAFCCQYCAYAAADLAGNLRLQYPPDVKVVLMPCTGRVDVLHVLRAFEDGADGVYVAGCRPGECHYLKGNLYAAPEQMLQKALAHIDAKRCALKLAPYDPGRWGASGDRRMRELEKLPLAERRTALYGAPAADAHRQTGSQALAETKEQTNVGTPE